MQWQHQKVGKLFEVYNNLYIKELHAMATVKNVNENDNKNHPNIRLTIFRLLKGLANTFFPIIIKELRNKKRT